MLIYFVQPVNGGLVKIGRSATPHSRLAQLQAHSPLELKIVGVARGSSLIENLLHRRFAAHRQHGEWFEPCEELQAIIDKLPDSEDADYIPTFYNGNPRVLEMYVAGYTMGEIGTVFGLSRQRIHQMLEEADYKSVDRKPIEPRIPPRDFHANLVNTVDALEIR